MTKNQESAIDRADLVQVVVRAFSGDVSLVEVSKNEAKRFLSMDKFKSECRKTERAFFVFELNIYGYNPRVIIEIVTPDTDKHPGEKINDGVIKVELPQNKTLQEND